MKLMEVELHGWKLHTDTWPTRTLFNGANIAHVLHMSTDDKNSSTIRSTIPEPVLFGIIFGISRRGIGHQERLIRKVAPECGNII